MKTAKKYTSLYFKNGITPSELNKITEAIKQAQSEAIDETVKACADNVRSGLMKSRWETVAEQLKAKL